MESRIRQGAKSFWRMCRAALGRSLGSRPLRRLRLCETLSLGERRFLAIVECENQRFLVGGTAASVALLSTLSNSQAGSPAEESEC